MYEVRSSYSFWGEPNRNYKKCFRSLRLAYEYMEHEDQIDTSHCIYRIKGKSEVKIDPMFLIRKYDKIFA